MGGPAQQSSPTGINQQMPTNLTQSLPSGNTGEMLGLPQRLMPPNPISLMDVLFRLLPRSRQVGNAPERKA